MTADPWTLAQYQALGFARSWNGKARLPSQEQMWREYPGAGNELSVHSGGGEGTFVHSRALQRNNHDN